MRIALRKKSNHHRRSADLPLLFLLSISIFVFVYLPPRVDRSKSNPRHRQCCVVFNNSGTEKKIVKQSKRANDKKNPRRQPCRTSSTNSCRISSQSIPSSSGFFSTPDWFFHSVPRRDRAWRSTEEDKNKKRPTGQKAGPPRAILALTRPARRTISPRAGAESNYVYLDGTSYLFGLRAYE